MKKIISVLMVLALAASLFAAAGAVEPYSTGDVDGDGQILATDARLALRASAKLEELTEQQKTAADVDGNGNVLADDARKILRVSAKLDQFGDDPVDPPAEDPGKPSSPKEVLKATGIETGYNSENMELYYHFTLANTSNYYTVTSPGIMVSSTGEEGNFDFPAIEAIRPGEVMEVAGIITGVEKAPTGADVLIYPNEESEWVRQTGYEHYTGGGTFGGFEIVKVNFLKSDKGGKVTGTVKNLNPYNVKTAYIYILRMNSGGRITAIDGLENAVTGIPAGKNVSFEIAAASDLGANDKIVVCNDGSVLDDTFGKVTVANTKTSGAYAGIFGVVFEATNPDSNNALISPQFRITAYGAEDADGKRTVLGVGYVTAQYIAPGATLKMASDSCKYDSSNGKIESFSITYVGCAKADKLPSGYKMLTTWEVTVGSNDSGKALLGYLSNPNNHKVKDVTVCVAVYSKDGSLMFVSSNSDLPVEEIDKEESAPFDVPLFEKPPTDGKKEVFILNWVDAD